MSLLIALVFDIAMIIWTVKCWKHECDYIKASWRDQQIGHVANGCKNFMLDTVITTTATTILGFQGFYAAGLALFMSNLMSMIFFAPPKNAPHL